MPLLQSQGLRLALSQFERRLRPPVPSRKLALPSFGEHPPGQRGQITADQFVLDTDKNLGATGVALPSTAPEQLPVHPTGFVPF